MSRTLLHLADLRTREKAALASFVALVLILTAALFVPRGEDGSDGGLAPTTGQEYVARSTAAGASAVTPAARAEIESVLDAGPSRVSPTLAPETLARELVRCAEFEEQQYCLGVGWTELDPQAAAARATTTAPVARSGQTETTGDLPTAELLAQRAAMRPAERLAAERAELTAAAEAVAKVVLLRHQVLGEPLPDGFLDRHPEARATTTDATVTTTARTTRKTMADYPRRSTVLDHRQVRAQRRTYWCGPATMQMIAWGWHDEPRRQRYWARRLGTTTSGSALSQMVRVVNEATGYDRDRYAGDYIVLDISDWSYRKWMLLQARHIEDYRAPVVLHPILLRKFYPYLDDDASGHFQVGRGYNKRGDRPNLLGYFEPWNQQRFDPSEPYIARVQWRRAYRSYRANQAHPHQNIGV